MKRTDLPVSSDLEKGFGDTPEVVSETIWRAANLPDARSKIQPATPLAGRDA
jgi:2-methylisocitrate lyase-like PEP mutase family enzyme